MRVLVEDNKILDSETNEFVESNSNTDVNAIGKIVIYNIQGKMCSAYYRGKTLQNKELDSLLLAINNKHLPYFIVKEQIKKEKSTTNVNKLKKENNTSSKKVDTNLSIIFLKNLVNISCKTDGAINTVIKGEDGRKYQNIIESKTYKIDNLNNNLNIKTTDGHELNSDEIRERLSQISETEQDDAAMEMLIKAKRNLNRLNPYYFCIISRCEQFMYHSNNPRETLSVSPGKLYICVEFVLSITVQFLTFILAHEASHLLLLHVAREKMKHKNHDLWNYAGDYIINKSLCEEFNIKPHEGNESVEMELGVYCANLDLTKDTTDSIYNELEQIYKEEEQKQQQQQNGPGGEPIDDNDGEDGEDEGSENTSSSGEGSGGSSGGGSNQKEQSLKQQIQSLLSKIKKLKELPENADVKDKIDNLLNARNYESEINNLTEKDLK